MTSRRILLSLLLCFTFDAAVPFELSPRGYVLEAEDQDEEIVRAERRRVERPADVREQKPPVRPAMTARLIRTAALSVAVAGSPERATPPLARVATSKATDPAAPAEDH